MVGFYKDQSYRLLTKKDSLTLEEDEERDTISFKSFLENKLATLLRDIPLGFLFWKSFVIYILSVPLLGCDPKHIEFQPTISDEFAVEPQFICSSDPIHVKMECVVQTNFPKKAVLFVSVVFEGGNLTFNVQKYANKAKVM